MTQEKVDPVSYDGETILIDTKGMVPGRAYGLRYRGEPAFAVAETNGSVAFFRIDEATGLPKGWLTDIGARTE